jgi:hypothetical protein
MLTDNKGSNATLESFSGSEPSSFGGVDLINPETQFNKPQFMAPDQSLLANSGEFQPIGDMLDVPSDINWVRNFLFSVVCRLLFF